MQPLFLSSPDLQHALAEAVSLEADFLDEQHPDAICLEPQLDLGSSLTTSGFATVDALFTCALSESVETASMDWALAIMKAPQMRVRVKNSFFILDVFCNYSDYSIFCQPNQAKTMPKNRLAYG